MYSADQLTTIHLEITSKCNALCPMCLRTVLGGRVNPQLPITELSLEDIKQIFDRDLLIQLKRIYLCGNYGDPAMARDTLEVLQYFRSQNPKLRLELFSNGGVRGTDWWSKLASEVDLVHFAIDGLEDTNHLYRRGVQWQPLMRNVQAFIAAGGRAVWDYIVFRHNEHQVLEAEKLSQDLGFEKFVVKKTGRFFSNTQGQVKERQEVQSSTGQVEYYLEMPKEPRYLNQALVRESKIIEEHGSLRSFFEKGEIHCKVATERSVYVSAEGLVFPCCWTANQLYAWYRRPGEGEIWNLIGQLPEGKESLSAIRWGLRAVVNGSFMQQQIPASWEKRKYADGRLFVCAKTCGQREFDAFRAQFEASASS